MFRFTESYSAGGSSPEGEVTGDQGATKEVVTDGDKSDEERVDKESPKGDEAVLAKALDVQKLKYEQDIANIRSSLDRQNAKLRTDMETAQNAHKQNLFELRSKGMNATEKQALQLEMQQEHITDLETKILQSNKQIADQSSLMQWDAYFSEKGIDTSILDRSKGTNAFVEVGWNVIIAELMDLRNKSKGSPPKEKPEPPDTAGHAPKTKGDGPGWKELTKRYGSRERVYTLIEQGDLPPTIIPGDDED